MLKGVFQVETDGHKLVAGKHEIVKLTNKCKHMVKLWIL